MRSRVTLSLIGVLALAPAWCLVPVATQAQGAAEPAAVERGRVVYRDLALCSYCHGWNGQGAIPAEEAPPAPLSLSQLDATAMVEVVRCGRPAKSMPRHTRAAWSEKDRCYGQTAGDLAARDLPVAAPAWLTNQQIADVVAFLRATIQGKEITRANCVRYWGEGAPECAGLQR